MHPLKILVNITKLLAINCAILQSHKQGMRAAVSLYSCDTVFSNSLDCADLIVSKAYVRLIMTYVSLIMRQTEHFFIRLDHSFFHYENHLSISSVHFSILF